MITCKEWVAGQDQITAWLKRTGSDLGATYAYARDHEEALALNLARDAASNPRRWPWRADR